MTSNNRRRSLTRGVLSVALIMAGLTGADAANADSISVSLREATTVGPGRGAGRIELRDSQYGLVIKPDLSGLKPGLHGLHVHQNPSCGPANKEGEVVPAGAAGGHYDPAIALAAWRQHLWLVGLKHPLKAGERFGMTLEFEKAGPADIEVFVTSSPGHWGDPKTRCRAPATTTWRSEA